jgi:glycosyltransferase involved in cell wall biosynthesis
MPPHLSLPSTRARPTILPVPRPIQLCVSLADQNVATTKSIGIYNFSTRLACELAIRPEIGRLEILTNRTIKSLPQASPRVSLAEINRPVESKLKRVVWDQVGVYRAAARSAAEWLMLPKGFASFVRRPPRRLAAYVHDIMGEYYHQHHPGFESRLEYEYFARSLTATMRHASVVLTNTEFTRGEILALARRRGLRAPRVVVAGYGFDCPGAEPLRGPAPKDNSVLLFASKFPHKRTDLAVRFLEHWRKTSQFTGRIDCIGIISDEMRPSASPAWNWIGRVPPAQGRELIRRSRAVVYVSEYEGFGMPPVEATLEGTCPVYSAIPPIGEVMAGAGHAFSNASPEEFATAMNRALATPAETVAAWAKDLLARHNWPDVTQRIVAALDESTQRA